VHIQPQPKQGEPAERYNWDSPILVSPHNPTTLFFASQRVWKSDNRGDSWTAISGDLTKNQERITLPIMGKQQSWDSPWDLFAMSNYNTITSISESPVKKGLIYAGTDDGLIQVTDDGGENWTKIEVSSIPDVPATAFVNDIKADKFDENTVYAVLDNHKYGDFDPYLVKSSDKGKSWQSIVSNLPERTLVWRFVQDHEDSDLMFVGTEFGIYFSVDGGEKWVKFTGDSPTISFRDLAIHERENDLIAASFGRGFYILDDYTPLRNVSREQLENEATLFPVRDAWWYMPKGIFGGSKRGSQGAGMYVADNPPFGAVITFYLKEDIKTIQQIRQEKEKQLQKEDADIPFPGWEKLDKEKHQQKPALWLTIEDAEGNIVRKLKAPAKSGFQQIAWDLRYPSVQPINEESADNNRSGMLVMPGEYKVTLSKEVDGEVTPLAGPENILVKPLREPALEGPSHEETLAFWKEVSEMQRAIGALNSSLNEAFKKINLMEVSLKNASFKPGALNEEIHDLKMELTNIQTELRGSSSKNEIGEKNPPTIGDRVSLVAMGTANSTYGPTQTHRESLGIAKQEFAGVKNNFEQIATDEIPQLLTKLFEAGAPWIEGMPLPDK
jgi:hypothetical protein